MALMCRSLVGLLLASAAAPSFRLLTLLAALGLVLPAHGQAVFVVTKATDTADGACDADCSLREAVIAANTTPGADTIRLKHAYYGFTRASEDDEDEALFGDLDLREEVTIRGLADGSTIDANFLGRVIEVYPNVAAELIDLVLKEGREFTRGGGVYNAGDLTLRRTQVTRSEVRLNVQGLLEGGGIANFGVLRLIYARVHRNRALESLQGGMGGGIYNGPGSQLYMYDSDVRDNVTGLDDAKGWGAGLFNWGVARIDRSFFGWNDPGNGEGAAMANRHGGSLAVFNTTVSANGHDGARGAIANGSENPSYGEPESKLNLLNVTIANNNGGGLYNAGRATMRNTIVASNYTQDVHDRWYDAGRNCVNHGFLNSHFSLVGADGNCPGAIVVDNATVFDVVLQHLTYLGGPTPIHPQRPGPYTIDLGDSAACPYWDQRRGRRPADGDLDGSELCDIGAAEHGADE